MSDIATEGPELADGGGVMDIPMEWQIYKRVHATLAAGAINDALRLINENRTQIFRIAGHIARLEADCFERLGARDEGLKILEYALDNCPSNFWGYYRIAQMYQKAGRNDDCIKAYRKAHSLIGWEESERNGYGFLNDYFSPVIPRWSKWFAERITATPINALEIGSWQGGSATWLLDKIISRRGGRLTCIDTFEGSSEHAGWIGDLGDRIEEIFDRNIAASGHSALCRKIVGLSQGVLRKLHEERFDFIYIDGAHEARYVIEDAVLAFGMLKDGGHICFDDYNFRFAHNPRQNTGRAVDIFLDLYEDEISFVEKGRQVLLQKGNLPGAEAPTEHT
jgi:predicted O-methyltransferase YrrM